MRFELSGTMVPISGPPSPANPSNPPILILTYTADDEFDPKAYMDQGYNMYEMLCIGGGGGPGGGIDQLGSSSSDTDWARVFGGAGGGGGLHYVKGSLLPLEDGGVMPIIVGKGGIPGRPMVAAGADGSNTADGEDGGYSSVGIVCQASGGKGGKRISWVPAENAPYGPNPLGTNGGDGGSGGTIIAGGGGSGGTPQEFLTDPNNPPPAYIAQNATDGQNGSWNPSTGIGTGGGGGAGGYDAYVSVNEMVVKAVGSVGGTGSWNPQDISVLSAGQNRSQDNNPAGGGFTIPGGGGGAKATPITGSSTTYGDSRSVANVANPVGSQIAGNDGIVVIKLTAR